MKPSYEIRTDGTAEGTKIVDLETGKALKWVKEVSWKISVGDRHAQAVIVLQNVGIRSYSREVANA